MIKIATLQRLYLTLPRNSKTSNDMKRLAIIIALSATLLTVSARVLRRQLNITRTSVPETETIAPETMEFVYDYAYCVDTTASLDDNYASDRMLLQIGAGGLSKFSSYRNLAIDSIIMSSSNEQLTNAAMEGRLNNGEFMTIYKNYPAGRLTHTEKICNDWMRYEEEIPAIEWRLTDTTTTVLGYRCQGAECDFRGRRWTAFFAEEIPLTDGPWKLHGLPGLIMKATDEKGEYTFECIGLRDKADRPITIYKVPYNDVDRKTYYDTKHRYEVNPYAYFEATTGGHITVRDENGNIMLDSYDPIELPFDYIELDWHK